MRYKLTGVNADGEVVEVTASSTAAKDRKLGAFEAQGYVVTVEQVPSGPMNNSNKFARPASSRTSSVTTSRALAVAVLAGIVGGVALMWATLQALGILGFLVACAVFGLVTGVVGAAVESAVERRRR